MKRNAYLVGLVLLIFFAVSLLTNVLGAIIPDIIESFGLTLTAASLLPFSFFIAYGVISIPAGILVETFQEGGHRLLVAHRDGDGNFAGRHQPAAACGGRGRELRFLRGVRATGLWLSVLSQPAHLLLLCRASLRPGWRPGAGVAGSREGGPRKTPLGIGLLGVCRRGAHHVPVGFRVALPQSGAERG